MNVKNIGSLMIKLVIILSMLLIIFLDSDSLWVSSSNYKMIYLIFYIVFLLMSILIVNQYRNINIYVNGLLIIHDIISFILL
ncbi:hypothetical protein BUZ93_13750 [Mammaliicoccus sciuri]|nr:hypothetical protein BUZ93_13750 [Mammaliicoccus sciuri]